MQMNSKRKYRANRSVQIATEILVAAVVESAERHFDGADKFDSGARWPSFTIQGGER